MRMKKRTLSYISFAPLCTSVKGIRLALLLLLTAVTLQAQEDKSLQLIINEVQVSNIDSYLDDANCYGGWIELYNPTDTTITLRGMSLVNGPNEYHILSAQGSVPAQSFKVLWFDHNQTDGQYGTKARRQIPYKLESDGDTITLLSSEREVISSVVYPAGIPRCSWARTTDGGDEWGWTGEPTPGASNEGSPFAEFRLEAPTVVGISAANPDSHLFTEPFKIRVELPTGYTLRYTTDGSTPTLTNGETSQNGHFDIDGTTILRFRYFKNGFLPGPVVTRSYIYRNHDYYLPILSVVSDPKHFFDSRVGVFVKGSNGVSGNGQNSACNWNMDWERPVNMEYMVPEQDADGNVEYTMVLNQETDLEICGGWTRAYGGGTVDDRYWEARSSFRLKTDKRYEGVNVIDYPVFPSKTHNKYRCWQVRNGGNDTYARIKDPAIQMMVIKSGFYVDCQDYQPAHVFLNGQYYGMLNIRESNNKHFAYSNYGIDFDDMDQFDLSNAQYNQKMGDNKAWLQLVRLAQQLGSRKTEELYRQVCELLDIDEYINYMALDCYIGPSDWITNTNNVKGFRSRTDGKFHFVLFDLDSAFGTTTMLTDVMNTTGGASVDDLFRNLMKYDPIRRQFLDAYCLVDGSIFEPTRCEQIVWDIYQNINPALSFEGSSSSTSLIYTIRSAHNGGRITTLRNYYGIASTGIHANISANIPEARLSVNGQEIPTGLFDGYLFPYKGLPVMLAAKAPAGYTFGGWLAEGQDVNQNMLIPEGSEWMFFDRGSMDNYDWKSLSFDEEGSGWRTGTAPFGFASAGNYMQTNSATKLDQGTGTKRPSYYFRKTFHLDAPLSDEDILTFNYQVDDGMMLYVNGHEVGGYYVRSGAPYSEYTIDQHYEGQTPYSGSFDIPHEYLLAGDNQIAVVAKNCHGSSSDMWFEGSLSLKAKDRWTVAETDTIDLAKNFTSGSLVTLKALFNPVTDERERWAAGASPLRINEVCASGDIHVNDYGKKTDWLELYNTTDEDISLEGLYLSDNQGKPQKFQFSAGDMGVSSEELIVPAHGTRIIWCDKKDSRSQLHAPFKLENADGAKVNIQAADGSWADCLEYMEQNKFQTFGRYPDGGNMSTVLNQPTIDSSNKLGMSDFTSLTDEDWLGRERTITLELAEGWNWTSHNMAESVDKSRFVTDALQMRGQGESLVLLDGKGWQGTLQALDAAKGYKIKMQHARDVTLRGNIFNTATPVALNAGWNWIGCPLYSATALETALGNYVPQEGDKIVGLDAFATREDGAWHGSLRSLQPGQAYLLYTAQAQEFCWQSLSTMRQNTRRYAPVLQTEDEAWETDIHAYPDVMTLVGRVEADEQVSLEGNYYVGAFSGDTCRGVGVMDDGLLYMNIHGESADRIVFRLLDADGETYGSLGHVVFQPETQLGTPGKPYRLWFASQEVLDEIKPLAAASSRVREVQYFNLSGQRIARPEHGICIRKTIYENGTEKVTKIYL